MKRVAMDCRAIDEITLGGLPLGAPIGIYGIRDIGKTIFCTQASARFAMEGYKVLYVDTEGYYSDREVFERIFSWFEKRWALDPSVKEKIEVVSARDLYKLGRLFGLQFELIQDQQKVSCLVKYPKKWKKEPSKKSRQAENWLEYSPLWKKLESEEFGLLVIDSITVPLKAKFPPDPQNFPARAFAIESLWDPILVLTEEFEIACLVTDHGSKAPMSNVVEPWGGQDMLFYNKRWIGILSGRKEDRERYGDQVRRFYLRRWPGIMPKITKAILGLNKGYIDIGSV